jgi:hypothetical protein
MPILTDNNIKEIITLFSDVPLSSRELPSPPHKNLASFDVKEQWSYTAPKIPLVAGKTGTADVSLTASGNVSVALFNDNDDKDDEHILSADIFRTNQDSAWLKYSLSAQAKASGTFELGKDLGISLGSDQTIIFSAYRKHKSKTKLNAALVRDIASFPTIFDVASIQSLEPQEALTMRIKGSSLQMELSIDWVQILAAALPALQGTLALGSLGNLLKVSDPSFITKFSAKITDDFALSVFREDADKFAVKLSSTSTQSFRFGLDASINIGLSETAQQKVQETINTLLADIITKVQNLSTSSKTVSEIIDKVFDAATKPTPSEIAKAIATLTPLEIMMIDVLAKALGLTDTITSVQQKIAEVKKKYEEVKETIERLIKDTVKVSLSYEYRRWTSQSAVLEATFTKAAFTTENHLSLVRFDVDTIVANALKAKSGITLQKAFTESIQKTEEKSGISLTIFGSKILKTTANQKIWKERKEFLPNTNNYAYSSALASQSTNSEGLFGQGCEQNCKVQLDIVNQADNIPQTASSLYLNYTWTGGRDTKAISGIFDHAALWGVIDPDNVESSVSHFLSNPDIMPSQATTYSCTLKIGSATMERILPFLAGTQHPNMTTWRQDKLISALAAAIPYNEGYGAARKNITARREAYKPAWEWIFATKWLRTVDRIDSGNAANIAKDVAGILRNHVDSNLYTKEYEFAHKAATEAIPGQTMWFAGLILNQENGCVVNPCLNMLSSMELLNKLMSLQVSPNQTTMTTIVDKMQSLTKSGFGLRVMGTFLMDVIKEVTNDMRDVERTLTITANDKPTLLVSEPLGW